MACWTESIPGKRPVSLSAGLVVPIVLATSGIAQAACQPDSAGVTISPLDDIGNWITPERVNGTLSTLLMLSALSLAPALLLMTTCFVRISIVLTLLRQAIGTQAAPSNQVLAGLAVFMTAAIMTPVWSEIYQNAVVPYRAEQLTWQEAVAHAKTPVHRFMAQQIERTGNTDDVWLFLERTGQDTSQVATYEQVPLQALAPAFLLSELKTAFFIGFQIYLPFLVIDLVVASVIAGMGLVTVPPAVISVPAKLLLFVAVDGWHLVVGVLLESFAQEL